MAILRGQELPWDEVHVFLALLAELHANVIKDSKHVTLEGESAIFLYTCVTGPLNPPCGERFQRLNDTFSSSITLKVMGCIKTLF